MIKSKEGLARALKQLHRVCHALASLRATVQDRNPENFKVMAESYIDTRDAVFKEIDAYLEETESATRGNLIHLVYQQHRRAIRKQTAARLAAIYHLVETVRDNLPEWWEFINSMCVEVMEDELDYIQSVKAASENASASHAAE